MYIPVNKNVKYMYFTIVTYRRDSECFAKIFFMYKCTLLSNETANYFVYPICWCKSDAALKKKKD